MKSIRSLVFAVICLCAPMALLADEAPAPVATAPAVTAHKATSSKTDEALAFILKKAEKYSDKAENALDKAVDIAIKETPETIAQFLRWRLWKHSLVILVPLIITIGLFLTAYLCWGKANWIKMDGTAICAMLCLAIGICFAIGTFVNASEGLYVVQIIVAPRIYLIEQAANILK